MPNISLSWGALQSLENGSLPRVPGRGSWDSAELQV